MKTFAIVALGCIALLGCADAKACNNANSSGCKKAGYTTCEMKFPVGVDAKEWPRASGSSSCGTSLQILDEAKKDKYWEKQAFCFCKK
jgi:hypothetical protein